MKLVVRAQTLALHQEGVAAWAAHAQPMECRVQIFCDGEPLKDEAEGAASSSGSVSGRPSCISWSLRSRKFLSWMGQAHEVSVF